MWFYSAPIVYSMTLVREKLNGWQLTLYEFNPLTRFVEAFRDVMYDLRMPPLGDLAYLLAVSVASLLLGLVVFSRLEGKLAEEL
jgi:ABC-2 type transport system permease protein